MKYEKTGIDGIVTGYKSSEGTEYRVEEKGCGIYAIFERRGDAFLFRRNIRSRSKLSALVKFDSAEKAA